MPDREKVIKDLESFVSIGSTKWSPHRIDESWKELQHLLADVLILLKEQEAVYPSWQNGKMYCGHCGSKFPPRVMMRFCHRCGVPIKLKVNDIVKQEGR